MGVHSSTLNGVPNICPSSGVVSSKAVWIGICCLIEDFCSFSLHSDLDLIYGVHFCIWYEMGAQLILLHVNIQLSYIY